MTMIKACLQANQCGLHKMVFLSLFTFSGIWTEQGCPVDLESITDLSSCHFHIHNNIVSWTGATRLWNCCYKPCCIAGVQIWQWWSNAKCHFQTIVIIVNSPLNNECIYIHSKMKAASNHLVYLKKLLSFNRINVFNVRCFYCTALTWKHFYLW